MATKKTIAVFERVIKTEKGKPVTTLKEVQTDGTPAAVEKAVTTLKKKGTAYFEVVDQKSGIKTEYSRTLSGKNYETKIIKS